MPVYNAARYVGEAIESVLAQTFRDFEFIIIDDGSTDQSAEIVRGYAARDDRIVFVSRENRGSSATRRQASEMSRADIIAAMDADDACFPDRFEKQIAFLDAHPEIDLVGSLCMISDPDLRPISAPRMPLTHEDNVAALLDGDCTIKGPTVMMRRDALFRAGNYNVDVTRTDDYELWLRFISMGRVANLPDVLLRYRIHGSSLSGSNSAAQKAEALMYANLERAKRGLPELSDDGVNWRPSDGRESQLEFVMRWGWQAWQNGNTATARHLFRSAVRLAPFSLEAWKALMVVSIKRPRPHPDTVSYGD